MDPWKENRPKRDREGWGNVACPGTVRNSEPRAGYAGEAESQWAEVVAGESGARPCKLLEGLIRYLCPTRRGKKMRA